MAPEFEQSNVVSADFQEHRRQISRQNSPFGPVIMGIVELEFPKIEAQEVPQAPITVHYDRFNPIIKGYDAAERTNIDPITNQRFYDM